MHKPPANPKVEEHAAQALPIPQLPADKPTGRFRFVVRGGSAGARLNQMLGGALQTLQQEWVRSDYRMEWRDVPVEIIE